MKKSEDGGPASKEDAIAVEGRVVEPLANAMFRVEMDNGHRSSRTCPERCGCTTSGSSG